MSGSPWEVRPEGGRPDGKTPGPPWTFPRGPATCPPYTPRSASHAKAGVGRRVQRARSRMGPRANSRSSCDPPYDRRRARGTLQAADGTMNWRTRGRAAAGPEERRERDGSRARRAGGDEDGGDRPQRGGADGRARDDPGERDCGWDPVRSSSGLSSNTRSEGGGAGTGPAPARAAWSARSSG